MKSGNLNFLEPSGPLQACNGTDLPFYHTENCAVHPGNPTVSSVYLPTPRWQHLKAHPFLAIHSADEHRMIAVFLFKYHFFMCCVLSGRGLCDELITRPEESYRLWCVVVCDLETSRMRRPWPAWGRSATGKENSNKLKSLKSSTGKCFGSHIWL